jgi:hypothetical protein
MERHQQERIRICKYTNNAIYGVNIAKIDLPSLAGISNEFF